MTGWPDASFTLLKHYVDQLDYRGPRSRRPCASVLRRFQQFLMTRSPMAALSRGVIEAWLRAGDAVSPRSLVIRRAQIVDTFLDWLVAGDHLHANPLAKLREACRPRGTRSIVPALLSEDPDAALAQLRPPPRYGSRVGPALRDHVERMRALGYKCDEKPYLRLDRFAQERAGADAEPLDGLIHAYAVEPRSPAVQYECQRTRPDRADTIASPAAGRPAGAGSAGLRPVAEAGRAPSTAPPAYLLVRRDRTPAAHGA